MISVNWGTKNMEEKKSSFWKFAAASVV